MMETVRVATVEVEGTLLAYDVVEGADSSAGGGRAWVLTPGGRFSKDEPGIRELAESIVAGAPGDRVLIWDRPNCGASDVCFTGASESQMQADHLAGLLRALDLAPAVIVGGSGGARVSLLTAATHPDVAGALAMLWISGGVYGLLLAYGIYFPRRTVILLFPPIPLPARVFVALFAALELYFGVTGTVAGVAHFAHLGGMLGAWLMIRTRRRRRT